jgi:flagellar biosynthesis GTPase FlhF
MPDAIAEWEVDNIELELEAMNMATAMDIDEAEAILRAEFGSEVSKMSSKEIKRDILVYARNNPQAFIELAQDDNVQLRNIGVKAVEANIIKLADNNRVFKWASNGRKLFTVPFEEQPYSALAAWFKTDEGVEVFNAIEKKLN